MRNDIPQLQSTKEWLLSKFSTNDLGKATYVLEIEFIEIDLRGC